MQISRIDPNNIIYNIGDKKVNHKRTKTQFLEATPLEPSLNSKKHKTKTTHVVRVKTHSSGARPKKKTTNKKKNQK